MDLVELKIGVIIVDDDLPLRQLLCSYLADYPQTAILGEASSMVEAFEILDSVQADVIFLDIELPNTSGLSAVTQLKQKHPFIGIVFITGYPEYAAQAFQLDAIDYLVKPISAGDVSRAIEKIERWMVKKTAKSESRIAVKSNHELRFINLCDIFYIEKVKRHSVLHTVQGTLKCSENLNSLISRLDNRFFRCHRSFIVNVDKIDRIAPIADRIYEISFCNYPSQITMGREKYEYLCNIIFNRPV